MNNTDQVKRYEELTRKKRQIENDILRNQTQLDTETATYKTLGKELVEKYDVKSIEKAEEKLALIEAELELKISTAEKALNSVEQTTTVPNDEFM